MKIILKIILKFSKGPEENPGKEEVEEPQEILADLGSQDHQDPVVYRVFQEDPEQ